MSIAESGLTVGSGSSDSESTPDQDMDPLSSDPGSVVPPLVFMGVLMVLTAIVVDLKENPEKFAQLRQIISSLTSHPFVEAIRSLG